MGSQRDPKGSANHMGSVVNPSANHGRILVFIGMFAWRAHLLHPLHTQKKDVIRPPPMAFIQPYVPIRDMVEGVRV
jgi:hypothetical protein